MRAHVAFVLPDLGGGGAQRVMLNLARGIDCSHFAPHLIAIGPGEALAGMIPPDVPLHRLDAPRLRSGLFRLVGLLRRLKPDIVVSTLGYVNLGLLAALPLFGRGTRLVVREANVVSATLNALPPLLPGRWLYRHLYPRAGAVVAQTDEIAAQIAAVAPGAAGRIVILPNPVDEPALRSQARALVRIPGPGLRLVAAGRLTRQKGFDRMIALMPELPSDTHLTVFGEGPERGALESQAGKLGLSDRIHFPGFSTGLGGALAAADMLVMPSRWEGVPNVALEALALGTPVVATPEAGLEEAAAVASAGAVRIAGIGPDFVAAIRAMAPSETAALRATLLPDAYHIRNVAARFNALLEKLAHSQA